MAIDVDKAFFDEATTFDAPIPGESLTVSPEESHPWDGPPEYNKKSDALEYFFGLFTSEEVYDGLMDSVEAQTPVMDLVKVFLYQAFEEGKINPDMMLLLAEPLAYMIAALAERAKIDFIIQDDEEDEMRDFSSFGQAVSTIESPEAGEEFPEEVAQQLEEAPEQGRSLLGEQ